MTDDIESGKKINGEDEQDPETFVAPETGYVNSEKTEDNTELPVQTEFELTPEIEEKIMDKVQDILKEGLAFKGFRDEWTKKMTPQHYEMLSSILSSGFLGSNGKSGSEAKSEWAQLAREKRNRMVHFQILGRSTKLKKREDKTGVHPIISTPYSRTGELSLIFDLSTFTDKSKEFTDNYFNDNKEKYYSYTNHPGKAHTYRAALPSSYRKWEEAEKVDGEPFLRRKNYGNYITGYRESEEEYGFIAYQRIAPRFFTGLMMSRGFEYDKEKDHRIFQPVPKEKVDEMVSVMTDVYKKSGNIFPIYDDAGNLCWPRQMNHEEVKQFVAERDAKAGIKNQEDTEGEKPSSTS